MKKNGKEEKNIKPIKLTKKEIKELQKQFPKLEENRKERLQNKIEIIAIVFLSIMLVGVLYVFYLSWNYSFVGI